MPRYPKAKKTSNPTSVPSASPAQPTTSTFGQLSGSSSNQPSTSTFGQLSSVEQSFGHLTSGTEQLLSGLSISGDSAQSEDQVKFAKKKYGTIGKTVVLNVNFFKINLTRDTPNYFHYNIEIIKEDDNKGGKKGKSPTNQPKKDSTPKSKKTPKRLNDEIFKAIFTKYKNIFQCGGVLPVFDGEKNFYSTSKFNLEHNQWSGNVHVKDKDENLSVKVNITIPEFSHGQNLSNLMKKSDQIMPVELQALDIIMRNGPRLAKVALGPNLFFKYQDPRSKNLCFSIGVQRGRDNFINDPILYGQFGHYQSVRKCEGGLYFNVDRAMAIFSYGGSLTEAICDIIGSDNLQIHDRNRNQIEEKIKGLKFSCLHLNYKRTFIIAGLSRDTIRNTKFKDSNGKQISVYDYFKSEYAQFCVKYPLNGNLPCVQVGSTKNCKYFPVEVCLLEEDEVYRRKLSPILQGMVTRKSSQQSPFERFKNIEGHMKSLEADSTVNNVNYMSKFGITIPDKRSTEIVGRVLDAPKVLYKDQKGSDAPIDSRNQGSWDMKGVQFYSPAGDIGRNWKVVNVHRINNRDNRNSISNQKMANFVKDLIREARNKGITLGDPQSDSQFNYRGKGTLDADLFSKLDKNCRLLIILIPSKDELYNEIKTVAELKRGVTTQCLNQEKPYWRDDRFNSQLLTNILLKINPKCSGTNNSIPVQSRPPILKSKLMIIGLDVTHPSPTDGLSKSIAAVVASYTQHFDKCFHRTVVQEKARKEVVNLKEIIEDLLKNFKNVNKFYPTKILVYRDGIGEGDFAKVINVELAAIQNACKDLQHNVTITYVMVQKRHNTRFIPKDIKPSDKPNFQNVKPGTVVDTVIVHHKFFEFYLCSHAGMMGTSRPTKYVVLHDENDLSADELQATTYYLCYLYPRCTKSSSIPPHVQYSHLLCKRGRSWLASLDNSDGQSSANSGDRQLSQAEINRLNDSIRVTENLQASSTRTEMVSLAIEELNKTNNIKANLIICGQWEFSQCN